LYSVGRKEEARAILAKLHSRTGDINSPLIDLEMEEIEEKVALDGSDSTHDISFDSDQSWLKNRRMQSAGGISAHYFAQRWTGTAPYWSSLSVRLGLYQYP
jgi:hypothetical protein